MLYSTHMTSFLNGLPRYIYALLVVDQGSGSTPKGPSQTPETMGWTKTKDDLPGEIETQTNVHC